MVTADHRLIGRCAVKEGDVHLGCQWHAARIISRALTWQVDPIQKTVTRAATWARKFSFPQTTVTQHQELEAWGARRPYGREGLRGTRH